MRIAFVGGGSHSRGNHLPALARYVSSRPGEIELAAFCDLQHDVAVRMAELYGFARSYADVGEMLAAEDVDGCIAITPVSVTAEVASRIIAAGIPLLMEKPPGSTVAEARGLCELVARADDRVMVSVNRRFDPALRAACSWRGDRPLKYVKGTMLRSNRRETAFPVETAIHCVDTLRAIAGDVSSHSLMARQVGGVWWYRADLVFENGVVGTLEVMPTCGCIAESYEMLGPDYRALVRVGETDSGEFTAWEDNCVAQKHESASDLPRFVRNGTYAETVEFLDALRENRKPRPAPGDVLGSVELCHAIQEQLDGTAKG